MNAAIRNSPAGESPVEAVADGYVDYFAYGSNLSTRQMKQRVGAAPVARLARLLDHQLIFNCQSDDEFFANVIPAPGQSVWGVIYRCEPRAIQMLDRYEGVAQGCYRRIRVEVETDDLERSNVEIYIASETQILRAGQPSADYLNRIIAGAKEHLLPEVYIRDIERLGRLDIA